MATLLRAYAGNRPTYPWRVKDLAQGCSSPYSLGELCFCYAFGRPEAHIESNISALLGESKSDQIFEARTLAIGEAIKLGAAIDYLSRIGMQMIHDYEALMHLFLYLVLVRDSELFYECVRALKAFASFHYKETIARKASFKGSCFHSSFLPPFFMNFALRPLASILRSS
ncbi:uncharacterized protein LOC110695666 isoform X2 [Chenopodium quinoa]|uniref:uncharacterized protein LOC110695666 isoform X2 n=1 Tax=Chenopodium quinoa TaxID=63459 RepID=UPI000B776CB4|nr:uncharacterized protein LOC110695666 isoform X2 [Chenopodium quinoa]